MKAFLLQLFRAAGYELKRRTPVSDQYGALLRALRTNDCATLLDVGANSGQFAKKLFNRGWAGGVVSFEPSLEAHTSLADIARRNQRWTVAPRMALGSESGPIELDIASNSQSSSILPMLSRHLEGAPESSFIATESVPMKTLEQVLVGQEGILALKMDVQGYESHVLTGAAGVLDRIPVVWTEMSLQPLYAGEPLFSDLAQQLRRVGYKCIGLWPGFADAHNGEMLQVDGLFVVDHRAE